MGRWMRRWPWFTLAAAVVAAVNPAGSDFLRSSFLSNEQLVRDIARPFVLATAAILIVLGVIEVIVRRKLEIKNGAPRG